MSDAADGYERHAAAFRAARSGVGAGVAAAFARRLRPGAAVLEIGPGFGWPVTDALVARGLRVFAVEPAPRLAAMLEDRLPGVTLRRERAEASDLFARRFDGAVMVGVLFLLEEDAQRALLRRVARTLSPGGRLLFSAPWQDGVWQDAVTGVPCRSVGAEAYEAILSAAGAVVVGRHLDEGGNHYVEAQRAAGQSA